MVRLSYYGSDKILEVSLDDVLELWKTESSEEIDKIIDAYDDLKFLKKPENERRYLLKKLFTNPLETEHFVRSEQDNEKIKDLLDAIYKRCFIDRDPPVMNWDRRARAGSEYIANIIYPLALQGKLQGIPKEYVCDAISVFEEELLKQKFKKEKDLQDPKRDGPENFDNTPLGKVKVRIDYEASSQIQRIAAKLNLIRQEYSRMYDSQAPTAQTG